PLEKVHLDSMGRGQMPPFSKEQAQAQIGTAIRRYRRGLGLTQEELAQAATVSVGLVRDLEQGRTHSPRWTSVEALALALGLDERARTQLAQSRWASGQRQRTVCPGTAEPVMVKILGPLTVERAGVLMQVGPIRRRAVLAML